MESFGLLGWARFTYIYESHLRTLSMSVWQRTRPNWGIYDGMQRRGFSHRRPAATGGQAVTEPRMISVAAYNRLATRALICMLVLFGFGLAAALGLLFSALLRG